MPLVRTVAPTVEPITVAQVKAWSRIDSSADDGMIKTLLIPAVRAYAETKLRRSLINQTWLAIFDAFPASQLTGVPFGQTYGVPQHAILLERPPVQSITSIQYVAMDGTTQTMATTDYVDLTVGGTVRQDNLMRVTPKFGKIWPITLPQMGVIQITYNTGYGPDGTSIPPEIIKWMLLRAAALYENREEVVVGTRVVVAELPYVDGLIDEYIVGTN